MKKILGPPYPKILNLIELRNDLEDARPSLSHFPFESIENPEGPHPQQNIIYRLRIFAITPEFENHLPIPATTN